MSRSCPSNGTLLPPGDPRFQIQLEQADLREQWFKQDWQQHFAKRMSYDEYRYINFLNAQVQSGEMVEQRARDGLDNYRKKHPTV